VTAFNSYGQSALSSASNGAVILNVPDAPLSLAEQTLVTTASQVGLKWTDGISNGGSVVIDYTISYNTGSWETLASGVLTQSYTTVVALTLGQSY
jgi:hypothetical protein